MNIQLHQISKQYEHQLALHHINLHIPENSLMFLTGHSGAGKSTLLKIIAQLIPPSTGRISIDFTDMRNSKKSHILALRQRMGIILQNPWLLPEKTVINNVAMPLQHQGHPLSDTMHRAMSALEKVGLAHKAKHLPMTLSVGEQQRASIARAIISKPDLILADEPTGNLDPELSEDIMKLFFDIHALGTSVIIATHNLPLIANLKYPIMVLKSGQMINH